MLASLNGHPLQSARWGESRRLVDGYDSHYLVCMQDGVSVLMARVETRKMPFFGKVAWIPRGPTLAEGVAYSDLSDVFHTQLRQRGFSLVISDLYKENFHDARNSRVFTIWIDLEQGLEVLKKKIDKQWMYGVRRAAREGVEVVRTRSAEDVNFFWRMCAGISQGKCFELPGSEPLMQNLLNSPMCDDQEMHLFLAKYEGRIGAGAFVARSGRNVHYFWGASDRKLSRQRVGEAVHWAVIEWAVSHGCVRYDLEGIDPINNPGVYSFKRKMGGDEVTLVGKKYSPLNIQGRIMCQAARILRKE